MKSIHKFAVNYPQMHTGKIKHGSLELLDDTAFKPEWKLILHGEVIENPVHESYKKLQIGDKIYFHYLEADEDNIVDEVLFVDAVRVFCYVRDGKIYPYGDYILTVPAYPDTSEEIVVDGKKIQAVVGKSGLVEKIDIKHSKKLTRVLHSEGNDLGVKDGDMVIMRSHSDQFYKIEGRDMFPIPQSEIIGIYEEAS